MNTLPDVYSGGQSQAHQAIVYMLGGQDIADIERHDDGYSAAYWIDYQLITDHMFAVKPYNRVDYSETHPSFYKARYVFLDSSEIIVLCMTDNSGMCKPCDSAWVQIHNPKIMTN